MVALCSALSLILLSQTDALSLSEREADLAELGTYLQDEILNTKADVSSLTGENVITSPSTVSIIDAAAIARYNFSSVTEAISALAGITVQRTSFMRDIPTIRGVLQAHYTDKVLILIDGVPAWMATTGEGNLNRIAVEHLARIEVLRGPASVLYGTNAYAGAINLVLKKAPSNSQHGEIRLRAGTQSSAGASATYLFNDERLTLRFFASGLDTSGRDYPFTDEEGNPGHVQDLVAPVTGTGTLRYATDLGEHSLMASIYRSAESFLGVTPNYSRGAGVPQLRTGQLVSYSFKIAAAGGSSLRLGVFYDAQNRNFARTQNGSVLSDVTGFRAQGLAQGSLVVSGLLTLDAGIDFDYRVSQDYNNYQSFTLTIENDNGMTGLTLAEGSGFVQARLDGRALTENLPLTLLLGGRYTQNELFGSNTALRGTAVYSFGANSSVKLVAGQSFRAPTLFEAYVQSPLSDLAEYGNSALRPELSSSAEASYVLALDVLFVQALGYYGVYNNEIVLVRRNPTDPFDESVIYANDAPAKGWGGELELRLRPDSTVDAFVSYAYTGGQTNTARQFDYRYVAPHNAVAGISKSVEDFGVATTVTYLHGRRGATKPLAAQAVWDVKVSYRGLSGTHSLVLNNVLDTQFAWPDYVRRNINSYRSGYGRTFMYVFDTSFDARI